MRTQMKILGVVIAWMWTWSNAASAQDTTLSDAIAAGYTSYQKVAIGACTISDGGHACAVPCTASDIIYVVTAANQYLPTSLVYVRGAIDILKSQNNQAAVTRATRLLADITSVITWNRHEMYRSASMFSSLPVFPWPKEYTCSGLVNVTRGLADRINKLQAYMNGSGQLNF